MKENDDNLVVEGYRFQSTEDADLARIELEKMKMLESRMDYNNIEVILAVYNKAILNRTFKTPVGFDYLMKIREYLLKSGKVSEEQLKPITMYMRFAPLLDNGNSISGTGSAEQNAVSRKMGRSAATAKKIEQHKAALRTSIAANIILGILIAAMFLITLYSDHPNILNYKTKITNEYASWEQELSEREQIIREKEKELQIESTERNAK